MNRSEASNAYRKYALYWDIGHRILKKQGMQGWGAKIIDPLAFDLREQFRV